MKIQKELNSTQILSPYKKDARHRIKKYHINGSWYFIKTNPFLSFQEKAIGYIQF